MRSLHVVTGLPRSGSTLLCALLDQRPETFVSATSQLCQELSGTSGIFDTAEERSRLLNLPDAAEHHNKILQTIADVWHDTDAEIVIDKSRAWGQASVALRRFAPEAVILCCVRDVRHVAASVERHHRATGQYHGFGTIESRLEAQFNPQEGLIGFPMRGVMDLINRNVRGVHFVKYERFVADPKGEMADVDKMLGLEPFDYNFTDFEYQSADADELYMLKYPHAVKGPVEAKESDWSDCFSKPTADRILASVPFEYNEIFRYS